MTETFINHCIKMYNALDERATDKQVESDGKTTTARIFAGSYFECWKSTRIAQTYYSPVRKALERHEAIHILQKGGRSTDTVIHLRGLPDTWDVDGWNDAVGLTKTRTYARLVADVQETKKLVGGINIPEALIEVERRLDALRTEVENLSSLVPKKSNSSQHKE